ncbi:hypothetical protein OIU34_34995 [Pararhizobium sp. BT-229]|nr:hypothetical protein [Pararhizobium sp. BT-229]MCV9967041.1 hypothetical protein [Pararhizobium sp. BT-229]
MLKVVYRPTYTTTAIAILGALKTVINIMRGGLQGLIKPQPPIR